MRKKLDDRHELFYDRFYPTVMRGKCLRSTVLLGIGGNASNSIQRFKKLFCYFQINPYIQIYRTSAILKNPPFGYLSQDDFFNAVMVIGTNFSPLQLLAFLQRTEKRFGRKRSFKNAPRTIDIDIIMFENIVVYNKKLTIPHPHWRERTSVLTPMVWMNRAYGSI